MLEKRWTIMKNAALVLEGGATRGVFTTGVLDCLMEKNLYLSHVIGVSMGACNAISYVSRQKGRTKNCLIHESNSDYDFYYMGAGTERKMKLMLPQLLKNRQVLCNACDEGKVLLFTGNACDVLGKSITDAEGLRHEALGIGSFETREEKTRINGDCIACFDGVQEELVGFINKCSWNTGVDTPLVSLRLGKGNEKDKPWDGFRRNNCLGTHLTGPLLAKNPAMLRYIAALITKEAVPLDIVSPFMIHGYEVTKRELLKRLEA